MASRKNNKAKDIVVLDDDDNDDGDVQQSSSSAVRHRRSTAAPSVVDLTGGATSAASGRDNNNDRRRNRKNNDYEVEFISSSTSSNTASASSSSSSSAIQFVGTKRPRPSNSIHEQQMKRQMNRASSFSFQQQNNNFNSNGHHHPLMSNDRGVTSVMDRLRDFASGSHFGFGGGGRGAGAGGVNSFNSRSNIHGIFGGIGDESMDSSLFNRQTIYGPGRSASFTSASSHSTNNQHSQSKKKRAKSNPKQNEEEPTTAMTKGKAMQQPQGFDAIDMYYPRLKANERTLILHNLLLKSKGAQQNHHRTKTFVHNWRVLHEKNHPKSTLWSLAKGLSEEISRLEEGEQNNGSSGNNLDQKMPAKTKKIKGEETGNHQKENKPDCNISPKSTTDVAKSDDTDKKATAPIGPLSGKVVDTLTTYFCAHLCQKDHKAMLNEIKPSAAESQDSLSCSICADDFDAKDTVACCGEEIHFFCKPCLSSFVTVTVQSGPIQSMTCPMPDCKSLFATNDVKSVLSAYEILQIEHREDSRDRRVALAAKAMLHCECGTVAIVTEEDMGDGRIACPGNGCGRRFCAKCGNDDHGKESCPPPAETVQWLDEHSKKCPNCSNRIEKNGGCDHMTCAPPGGCGYDFWWTCGCPYRGAHKCGLQSRFSAARR